MKFIRCLLILLIFICSTLVQASSNSQENHVYESFVDDSGCGFDYDYNSNVRLNWIHSNDSTLAAKQRAENLGAENCSTWINGAPTSNSNVDGITKLVETDLQVTLLWNHALGNDGKNSSELTFSGLQLSTSILPLENLSESLNMRWYITVDYDSIGDVIVHDLVKHYGWTSSFYHEEGNITNWTHEVSIERLQEDGLPTSEDELWRMEVVILFVDDLNHTIYGADKIQLEAPTNVPNSTAEKFPTILIGIVVIVGLLIIVRQDQRREIGLPRLRGTLYQNNNDSWYAKVMITAGIFDVTLKGAFANEPWKMGKVPTQQLIPAETSRSFTVKMKCSGIIDDTVPTHWKVDVDELGGWVLDLNLPIND